MWSQSVNDLELRKTVSAQIYDGYSKLSRIKTSFYYSSMAQVEHAPHVVVRNNILFALIPLGQVFNWYG